MDKWTPRGRDTLAGEESEMTERHPKYMRLYAVLVVLCIVFTVLITKLTTDLNQLVLGAGILCILVANLLFFTINNMSIKNANVGVYLVVVFVLYLTFANDFTLWPIFVFLSFVSVLIPACVYMDDYIKRQKQN